MALAQTRDRADWTAQDLLALGEDFRGELVDGRLVPMSPTKALHGMVCANLVLELGLWCRARASGLRLVAGEAGFVVSRNPDVVLVPDVALVDGERAARGRETFIEGAPDVAIEVLSESNTLTEMERKLRYYFAGGARSVWFVDPSAKAAFVYHSLTERSVFLDDAALEDPNLEGFSLPLSILWA
jgi:Uma2 family endonuclease